MNTIHSHSSLTPLPEYDLWGVPPTQFTVEFDKLTEHRPISILNSKSVITFDIMTSYDEYISLRETLLYFKLRIDLKKNSGDLASGDWDKVSTVNNLLHSLFKQVEMEIDGKSITLAPNTYGFKAYFETLLGYTDDAKKSFLTASLWHEDSQTNKDSVNTARSTIIQPSVFNTDGKGKVFEMLGKLHLDLAFQPKALLG
jgi:hypothetical protein